MPLRLSRFARSFDLDGRTLEVLHEEFVKISRSSLSAGGLTLAGLYNVLEKVRAVLQGAARPMDAAAVSRAFKGGGRKGGKKIEQRVVQALNTLVRYAEITALPDGTFAARKAA